MALYRVSLVVLVGPQVPVGWMDGRIASVSGEGCGAGGRTRMFWFSAVNVFCQRRNECAADEAPDSAPEGMRTQDIWERFFKLICEGKEKPLVQPVVQVCTNISPKSLRHFGLVPMKQTKHR